MGLVFALQPDLRKSKAGETLVLKTSKRRFSLGAGLLFGAALLGTMYTAAKPLFEVLWNEGSFFDKILTALIVGSIVIYPLIALLSWSLEETVILEKTPSAPIKVKKYFSLMGFQWGKKTSPIKDLSELKVENWKGALNMAALNEKAQKNSPSRYATRGHWILRTPQIDLEKRAKRDEVELLKAQIESFFQV